MFKVNNKDTRPTWVKHWRCSRVFIANFEYILQFFSSVVIANFEQVIFAKKPCVQHNCVTESGLEDFYKMLTIFLKGKVAWLKTRKIITEIVILM